MRELIAFGFRAAVYGAMCYTARMVPQSEQVWTRCPAEEHF
jgi:hypothetical protein